MLVDEIESEIEYNSLESISPPVLRSTFSNPYIKRQDRGWTPISLHLSGKQTYRFSSEDNKCKLNVRTSVQSHNLLKTFKNRHSSDDINDEVDR